MNGSEVLELEANLAALLGQGALTDVATLIVERYGPGILGYLAAVLQDDQAAREVFSEFGEELWKALPRFAGRSTVRTWAYAIAYRCALRLRRTRARDRTRPLRDSEYERVAVSVATTSRTFSRTAAAQKLDALRRTLSQEEQTLLVLRLDRGMAWDEIALVLGTKGPAAVVLRKRWERLKQRLRRAAERDGLLAAKPPGR